MSTDCRIKLFTTNASLSLACVVNSRHMQLLESFTFLPQVSPSPASSSPCRQ